MHVAVVAPADQVLAGRASPGETPRCAARSRRSRPCAARRSCRARRRSLASRSVNVRSMLMSWSLLGLARGRRSRRTASPARDTCGRLSQPRCRSAGAHSRCGALCWHISRNGLRLVAVLQPVERQVGDDVGDVARVLRPARRSRSSAGCSRRPAPAGCASSRSRSDR